MNTLDDELLFMVNQMSRMTNYQKKLILYPLNAHYNIFAEDGVLAFLSPSEEPGGGFTIEYGFEFNEIFSLDNAGDFLIILCNDASLFVYFFNDLKLDYWNPTDERILSGLSRWRAKHESGINCLEWLWGKVEDCLLFIENLYNKYKSA